MTIGAVQALHQTGRQCDIALVGFDDIPFSETFHRAITVIAQNIAEIGRKAAERVLARIGGDVSPARLYVVKSTFIARGSGEIPVSDSRRKADVRHSHIQTDNGVDRMEP